MITLIIIPHVDNLTLSGGGDAITHIEIQGTIVLLVNHLFLSTSYIYRSATVIANFYEHH
jgi:4-diphosphocytidyl-2C-methyl-D-erythritol kinase